MKEIIPFLILCIMLYSCRTYYIPKESLQQQFAGIDSTDFKLVKVKGSWAQTYTYLANPIKQIKCVDKNGNQIQIANSPSIEIRVTQNSGKKAIFYFDRIYVNNSILYGVKSRFIPSAKTAIPFKTIKKIEVQDGKKNFKYVN